MECKHNWGEGKRFDEMVCTGCGITYLAWVSPKLDVISKELDRIARDPEVRRRGEELSRELSRLTPEDYMREFTI